MSAPRKPRLAKRTNSSRGSKLFSVVRCGHAHSLCLQENITPHCSAAFLHATYRVGIDKVEKSVTERICPKCQGKMEVGVIPDVAPARVFVSAWQRGPAEKGLLGGLKRIGRTSYEITAYRCTSCGYIESYSHTLINCAPNW